MKLSRISRVVKILTTLQSDERYGVEQLCQILGVSRRTFFRDLKELEAIGVPYSYDSKSRGYQIDPDFFLPPVDLNLSEALSIMLLVHRGRQVIPMPLKNSALLAGLKIENNLPRDVRQYCNATLENVSIRPTPHSKCSGLDTYFNQLQQAIKKNRIMYMRYHSLYEGEEIELLLEPFHLMFNRRAWYILGYSSMHDEVRMFNLKRIRSLKDTGRCHMNERGFEPEEFNSGAWSMIPEGRMYHVKLHFFAKVAHNVSEVQWHHSQQVQWQNDGSVIIQYHVNGINEISWWIMGYGDQVSVLEPRELRELVHKKALKMAEHNEPAEAGSFSAK